MIEESLDIRVQNPICVSFLNHDIKEFDGVMATPIGTEPHHFVVKHRLEHRFQDTPKAILYQFIFVAVYVERPRFAIVLWNLDSPRWFRNIAFTFEAFY